MGRIIGGELCDKSTNGRTDRQMLMKGQLAGALPNK